MTITTLKEDIHLFSRPFIVCTARDLDLSEFFQYENQKYPPLLSVKGMIRPGVKAPLAKILETFVTTEISEPSTCHGVVFDGAAITHLLKPKSNFSTFKQYSEEQFMPYLKTVSESVRANRIDVAWDLYVANSLKATTRDNRGSGLRQHNLPNKGKSINEGKSHFFFPIL